MTAVLPLLLAALGCAPPDPIDPDLLGPPSIKVLFPASGQTLELNEDCQLDTVIVVDTSGIEIVDFTDSPPVQEGEGHWHGGPSLDNGFCRSFDTFCEPGGDEGYTSPTFVNEQSASIFATLVTNDHRRLGEPDQIEINVVAPPGVTCP
ncbi:MAG: hypothetical protein AAF602_30940 [Myxococcota bacterium]